MYARLYRALYRIRRVEETIARVYPTDVVKSPCHLSIGQEAASVGVCDVLRPKDIVFGTYRGHALYLAKGGDLNKMIAELYGKATGCAKGKGGSMHLVDVKAGVMGASAVVGTTIPQAVGCAYAQKRNATGNVVVVFFGDGATEEGVFHESMNFAALKKLPVLFVCENNGYAIHAPLHTRQAGVGLCERARSYGMPAVCIEGGDVLELRAQTECAVNALREGDGPAFLEVMTYRWREHVGPGLDFHGGYRTEEEARFWIEGDQVTRIGQFLAADTRLEIEEDVEREIAAAFDFATDSPWPAALELFTDLFLEAA